MPPLKKRYKFVCIALSLVFISAGGISQTDSYDNIRFKRYDAEQGLPSGACDNMYQDKYGFLWVSNYYGVSIFDGTHFFNLPTYSSDSNFNLAQLPHNFLQADSISMLISSPNGLYLYHYKTNTVEKLKRQPLPVSRQPIHLIGASASGEELYAETAGKLYVLNRALTIQSIVPYTRAKQGIRVNTSGVTSDYFYLTTDNHFVKINIPENRADTLLKLPAETRNIMVNADNKEEYLVCTDHAIYRVARQSHKLIHKVFLSSFFKGEHDFELKDIAMDNLGNYWIGGYNKLFVYFTASNTIKDKTQTLLESGDKEQTHVVDIGTNKDEIYLSTRISGILISDRTALVKNYSDFPSKGSSVSSIVLHNEKLLFADFKNDINIVTPGDNNSVLQHHKIRGLAPNSIATLENLDRDHIWTVLWNDFKLGIINASQLSAQFPTFPVDSIAFAHKQSFDMLLPSKDAIPIIKKAGDQLFYYSANNQLFRVEGSVTQGFRFMFLDSIASPHYITCIEVLSSGQVTVGTSGLQVYNLEGVRLKKAIDLFNPNIPVRFVLEDSRQHKYLLTTNGIYVFDAKFGFKEHLCAESKRLPGNISYSGFIDNRDILWAATNGGAIAYDCVQRSIFKLSALRTIVNSEFNSKSLAVDDHQNVYFGGVKGVTAINTNLFSNKKRDFHLFFYWIKNQDSLLHNSILPGSIVNTRPFPHYKNNFSFSVHAISTLQAEPFEMRYKMEGIDSAWRIPTGLTLEYMDLKPGKYKLIVTGKYPDSDTVREVSYSFRIKQPFWEELWFVLLVSITFFALMFLILNYWYRKKFEKERIEASKQIALKSERERISQELHDDLGSGLTSIRLLSSSVSAHPNSPRAPQMLADIGKVSGELIDQMSEIIWVLNHSDDSFNGLIAHLRIYMASYLQRIDLPMRLDIQSNMQEDIHITSTQRRNILLVAKEAFHNTVKHSRATVFSIQCGTIGQNILQIVISDNGIGIPEGLPTTGNGLNNIKRRISSINGEVKFDNNNGTNITINIFTSKD
ncbi:MAG: hypothetical protein KF862_07545 [Chitinophagaceae bacterium]|nr:hypothetical protein [Chitinophagaceae bacterium]